MRGLLIIVADGALALIVVALLYAGLYGAITYIGSLK